MTTTKSVRKFQGSHGVGFTKQLCRYYKKLHQWGYILHKSFGNPTRGIALDGLLDEERKLAKWIAKSVAWSENVSRSEPKPKRFNQLRYAHKKI